MWSRWANTIFNLSGHTKASLSRLLLGTYVRSEKPVMVMSTKHTQRVPSLTTGLKRNI